MQRTKHKIRQCHFCLVLMDKTLAQANFLKYPMNCNFWTVPMTAEFFASVAGLFQVFEHWLCWRCRYTGCTTRCWAHRLKRSQLSHWVGSFSLTPAQMAHCFWSRFIYIPITTCPDLSRLTGSATVFRPDHYLGNGLDALQLSSPCFLEMDDAYVSIFFYAKAFKTQELKITTHIQFYTHKHKHA